MERLGHSPFDEPGTRFALDNIRDGVKDDSMIVWEAHDTKEDKAVWVLGRKIPPPDGKEGLSVLPCAILLGDSMAAVKRYAPAFRDGWDYSRIEGGKHNIIPRS